jgi:hypothetical protein
MVRFLEADALEIGTRIATRYVGRIEGARYAESLSGVGEIVRLEPGRLRAWDFADEY